MANFNTHLNVALVASGVASSSLLTTGLFSPTEVLTLWLAGAFGGMLPDIDADDSKAIRVIFNLFGGFAALLTMLNCYQKVSVVELWLLAAGVFVAIRYLAIIVFGAFTVHRGSIHSLLAVFLCGLIAVCSMDTLGSSNLLSWWVGIFTSTGMIVHLLLDELYSVDISNVRIKRSFGSALKLADFRKPVVSILQLVCIGIFFNLAPPTNELINRIENWSDLQSSSFQFWPDWNTWSGR